LDCSVELPDDPIPMYVPRTQPVTPFGSCTWYQLPLLPSTYTVEPDAATAATVEDFEGPLRTFSPDEALTTAVVAPAGTCVLTGDFVVVGLCVVGDVVVELPGTTGLTDAPVQGRLAPM
jgi:hypothetical protein